MFINSFVETDNDFFTRQCSLSILPNNLPYLNGDRLTDIEISIGISPMVAYRQLNFGTKIYDMAMRRHLLK